MKRSNLVFLLFVAFRLSLLAFWPADELARWSDYDYYYELASWVDEGRLPYLHYWVEYPPLFPYLSVFLYLLTPHYVAYATGLALIQLLFEAGSLVLLYRLALRTLGEARASQVVWVYALLFAPVVTWWLSFDAVTSFFLLLAVERWMAGRRLQSALALGVGGLVKWFPLLFLPVAVRFRRSWREAVGYAAVAVAVVTLAPSTPWPHSARWATVPPGRPSGRCWTGTWGQGRIMRTGSIPLRRSSRRAAPPAFRSGSRRFSLEGCTCGCGGGRQTRRSHGAYSDSPR
jgi:hypothetical protein